MKNRVRELREDKKLTQVELGERVGKSSLTISRIERGEIGLSTRNAEQFARALGVTADELFVAARSVPVVAAVQAGEWAESWQWEEHDWFEVPVARDSRLDAFRLFGVETRGPSMNRRYPAGTILILADHVETQEELQPGKRYVVERERADGLREATVKTLWRDENGRLWLLPESTDPRFQEPIAIDGVEGETVRIVGRVLYALARE